MTTLLTHGKALPENINSGEKSDNPSQKQERGQNQQQERRQERRRERRRAREYISRPIILIFCVLAGCLGVIYFSWSNLQDIERALPINIAKQERDVALLIQEVSDLAWQSKLVNSAPSPQGKQNVLDQVARIENRLVQIRGTYNFDNLVGASAMHAVISPVLTDIKLWMSNGIQGVPAGSPLIMQIVETRAQNAIDTMRPMFARAQQTTFGMLSQQSARILTFRNFIVFFLVGILLTTVLIIFQMYRLKKIEHSLFLARETAEKANKAKSEFLATMSHEFRTPLNAILGFSEMMQGQYFGPLGGNKVAADKYHEYTNDIHHSGRHLLSLVNDILDIATIEAGKRYMNKEHIETDTLLRDSIKSIKKRAQDKRICLELNIAKTIAPLYADKRSVTQIILNLLSNAVKFTEQGGQITLTAKEYNHELKGSKFGSQKGAIEIIVRDNGIGIAADRLPTITDAFTQTESNPHRTQEGTGLGLSIVKALIEAHGGSLQISSDLGQGTEVTIILPN